MPPKTIKLFILCPCPKSGSTLLAHIISDHPLCGDNTIRTRFAMQAMLDNFDWVIDNVNPLVKNTYFHVTGDYTLIREFVHNTMYDAHPSTMAGVKFTEFSNFSFLQYLFPEAYFIIIKRDFRDTYASYVQFMSKAQQYVEPVWEWGARYMTPFYMNVHKLKRALHIHYEDLVYDLDNTMSDVWKFLDVKLHKPSPDLLKATFDAKTRPAPGLEGTAGEDGLCHTRIGRYEQELDSTDQKTIMRLHKDLCFNFNLPEFRGVWVNEQT